MSQKRACVVVIGDIGRSPRMQYHAVSLAKEGYSVDFVGYGGSSLHSELALNPAISLHHMKQPPSFFNVLPKLVTYVLKTLWQTISLFFTLCCVCKPNFILVQNPPSIPTLPVCWFISWARKTKLIVDWHNYGYTILALSLGEKHGLVHMCHFIERLFGRYASLSFCVSKAMKKDLEDNWDISATTLYDRPAEMFKTIDLHEQHELFLKLSKTYSEFSSSRPDDTLLTERFADGQVRLREDRPGLIVSSTSWTEDEDFGVLLDALDEYELNRSINASQYPPLLCVITGKGPMKSHYLNLIEAKQWQHIEVCTPWLDPEDYPKLIASANLGVCLHTSSSGLDLPMKVLDMFGSGLPVCAIEYDCLNELVKPGKNGMTFRTASDLTDQILLWFKGFPRNNVQTEKYRENLKEFQKLRWHDQWMKIVLPLLSKSCDHK